MYPWIEAIFGNVKGISLVSAVRPVGLGAILPYLISKKSTDLRLHNAKFSAHRMKSRMEVG